MAESLFTLTWDYAPEWAQWFAFDQDGFAFWYEVKPDMENEDWVSAGKANIALNIQKEVCGWKDSLRQRPS